MKIRGHGNGIAIALAALAVVIGGAGATYAVAATTVNIVDPAHPTHAANVSPSGRLATSGVTSTIDSLTNFAFDTVAPVTSPTTATLAISSLSYSNPGLNSQFPGSTLNVAVTKIHAGTTGECIVGSNGAFTERFLGSIVLNPGDNVQQTYPAPLTVRPTGTDKYCIGISVTHDGGSQTSLYLSRFQMTAFVVSGSYSGLGLGAAQGIASAAPNTLVTK